MGSQVTVEAKSFNSSTLETKPKFSLMDLLLDELIIERRRNMRSIEALVMFSEEFVMEMW